MRHATFFPSLARISHTLAGAGLVLAVPTGFRTLPIHPVLAAARKPVGTTMPCAIIPQQHEKRGLAVHQPHRYRHPSSSRSRRPISHATTSPSADSTTMPASRLPVSYRFPADSTNAPIPRSAPIISAATSRMIAIEVVTRKPLSSAGSAPGSTILRTIDAYDRPKLWPMRISPRDTLSTPPTVAITVGKNTPNARVTIFEPSPMPNQMMNSGTSAIFGIGNSAETTAIPGERSADHNPTASPMPMPNTVPTLQPIASRSRDADR